MQAKQEIAPILLFNDECGVCRSIAHWVQKSLQPGTGEAGLKVRPIGEDPAELRSLNPRLDIWDAYGTIHLLMPDGSMRLGGVAVAEVLRRLPNTRWFSGIFGLTLFGFRPFQTVLNLAYAVLADIRPIFGCESCGTPSPWVRPLRWIVKTVSSIFGKGQPKIAGPHFTAFSPSIRAQQVNSTSSVRD